ncbi:MAG TPA: 50S ribosomal protein L5 [Acidobacteriota bacterium]|nr:50S ribosomal protein L5 [Acidobacteriota bacterium]
MTARYMKKYFEEVKPALSKEFGYTSPMAVPRFTKIVINMGLGEGTANPKVIESATKELAQIAGQAPMVRRARKSIAAFKLRAGMEIGCAVTLRRDRMFEFYDRLVNVALPRVRDFRGVPIKGFDGRGNYTFGLRDQLIFPEIDYSKIDKLKGLSVTIVTTARTDEEAHRLLQMMDFPFRR